MPQLIQAKTLIPRDRKGLLHRERLVNFLHGNIDRRLIIITAPAGYGKTSLLVDFARDADFPICWLTLDENDRNLRDFLEYFVAAIEQQFPNRLPETRRTLANWAGDAQGEVIAGMLVNEILRNIPEYFAIVLDDYHLVDDITSISLFLDSFLRYQPENCHLIIAARTIPTLTPRGMALLVANQQIAGLGGKDLQFTGVEVRDLLRQKFGEEISLEDAEELARESEGWITGILLTRHRIWEGVFAGRLRGQTETAGVYDFLANEVFERLDKERQDFLLNTSILNIMSPALCDALLNRQDSQTILESLEDRNLFTIRVERGAEVWYQYHRLFRGFLLSKLHARGQGQEISLHIRAARYLEQEGDLAEAIHHYLEAGAYRDAARCIDQVAEPTYDTGRLETLLHWIDALPKEVLQQSPRLAWFKAKILWNRGDLQQSIVFSDQAREGFDRLHSRVGVAQALIEKSAVLRVLGRIPEAIEGCIAALAELEGQPLEGRDLGVLAGAYRNLGICHAQSGDIIRGIEELRQALEIYEQAGYRFNVAQTHSDLGGFLRATGNLTASDYHFEQALAFWEKEGNVAGIALVLNSLGVSYHQRGAYEKALDVYDIALRRAREAASDRLSGFILAGMGDTYLACGDTTRAIESYHQSQPLAERAGDTFLSAYLLGALAMAHLLRGEPLRALELARQAYERAKERGARQEAATYQIVLGAVCYQQGRTRRALDYLTESVQTLRESRAYRDMARAQLHLAQAYYRAGRVEEALNTLEELTDTILDLGQDQFLVPEARQIIPFLEYAANRGVGADILASLLEKARTHKEAFVSAPQPAAKEDKGKRVAALPVRAYALGEARVLVGDEPVPAKAWGSIKAKQLFFYLLSNAGQRKEQIGAIFWPDLPPAKMRSAFHVTTYRLRHALQMSDILLFDEDRYQINRQADIWYDVWEFERLLNEADRLERSSPIEAADRRREAIELVRGEFCEDLPDMEWQSEKREELRRRYLDALMRLGEYELEQGEAQRALSLFRRVLAWDELREDAYRGIMRALAALGDRAGALKQYQELVDLLLREMEADPTPETTRLYHQIASAGTSR